MPACFKWDIWLDPTENKSAMRHLEPLSIPGKIISSQSARRSFGGVHFYFELEESVLLYEGSPGLAGLGAGRALISIPIKRDM